MCSYLTPPRNGTYYFRMSVPPRLRQIIGQREFFFSLKTKDRETAKRLVLLVEAPRHMGLLEQAEAELARQQQASPSALCPADPLTGISLEEFEQEQRYRFEQAWADASEDDRMEEAEAYVAALPVDHPAAMLLKDAREHLGRYRQDARRRRRRDVVAGGSSGVDKVKPSVTITGLFELYGAQDGIAPATVKQWRNYIKHLAAFLGHDDAQRVTAHDLIGWRESLRSEKTRAGKLLSSKTINGSYLAAVNVTFSHGLDQRLLSDNPMASVKPVRPDKKLKLRDKDFTKAERRAILSAALKPTTGRLSEHRKLARRWVPWLCSYTGARVNEMTQLRAEDVTQIEGVWTVHITPEAGGVKTNEARIVPLHEHLIAQGFLGIVKGRVGPLFYVPTSAGKDSDRGQHKRIGMWLADWVRNEVGVTDPNVAPNHGWRHTFKTICREAEVEEGAADYMQGHAHHGQGRKYGGNTLPALSKQLGKFPRYDLGATVTDDCRE